MTNHKSFSARADIEAILESRDAPRTDIAVLQPADPFLDTAGEELRRRIFLTQSDHGVAMCLRPEFTIPVCRHYLEENKASARYGYIGTVFRQRREGGAEFLQAGIEDIGHDDVTAADARSLADCLACIAALNAPAKRQVVLGDQAVFDAVLAALGLPRSWRIRLAQAFGNDAALNVALAKLSEPTQMPVVPRDVQVALEGGDEATLKTVVESHMAGAGIANAGGRSAAEITTRLFAKLRAAQSVPESAKLETLKKFLNIKVPLSQATKVLEAFEHDHNLDLGSALAGFAKRNSAFVGAGVDLESAVYSASFGRPLDYYTGLVYEVRNQAGTVLAGGGRYDRLLSLLGADRETNGVGFSLWLDRMGEMA